MSPPSVTSLSTLLTLSLPTGVDPEILSYLSEMLFEMDIADLQDPETVSEAITPFLESAEVGSQFISKATNAVVESITSSQSEIASNPDNVADHIAGSQSQASSDLGLKKLHGGLVIGESRISQAEEDANAYLWGTDTYKDKFNAQKNIEIAESSKDRRKAKQQLVEDRKQYEEKVRQIEFEESQNSGKVAAMVLPDYSGGRADKDIVVRDVSLDLDNGRRLLDGAELKFTYKKRYGLVGKNGIGKTTLLKEIASFNVVGFPRHHRVLHVRQEIKGSDKDVISTVLEADVERNSLLEEETVILAELNLAGKVTAEKVNPEENALRRAQAAAAAKVASEEVMLKFDANTKRLDEIYSRLAIIGGDNAVAKASLILNGLQFSKEMQTGPTSALSGGWRMRVSLAAALFIEPDLLMLDEPSTLIRERWKSKGRRIHLDLEAVLWLESYLLSYRHSLIVVSHDRGFLNEVCTDIIEFKDQKLNYFKGNFDSYIKTSSDAIKNQKREYAAYQEKRAHLQEFIDRFRCNAKRATLVQSRVKTVEKMDALAPADVEIEKMWRFSIENPEPLGRPVISVDDIFFDYNASTKDQQSFLLQKVNFGIDLSSKIGILGPNGCGKSTLLNLIMGKLTPQSGTVVLNGRLRIAHFTQHATEKFDLSLSSIENMLAFFPKANDQEMRGWVGRFQISGGDATKPMVMLSGGQKSRVAFAVLCYTRPHVIIMDEPTNHLDMESIDALCCAISDFKGGVIVVSHDQYFITKVCTELWVVGEGKAERFRGDFEKYKSYTLDKTRARVEGSVKSLGNING